MLIIVIHNISSVLNPDHFSLQVPTNPSCLQLTLHWSAASTQLASAIHSYTVMTVGSGWDSFSQRSLCDSDSIKGHLLDKIHFYMLSEQMCVGSVCTQPPYNDKNPPASFF